MFLRYSSRNHDGANIVNFSLPIANRSLIIPCIHQIWYYVTIFLFSKLKVRLMGRAVRHYFGHLEGFDRGYFDHRWKTFSEVF